MDKFNWFFDKDRYTVYKTFKHDSSIVYRMTTWTNWIAYTASWLLPTKVNVVFLKVQSNTNFAAAYDALRSSGLTLDANARSGLDGNVKEMFGQKIQIWNTVAGGDIKSFCVRNMGQVYLAVEEVGHLRIFYAVWEPDVEKRPRTDGFQEFCAEKYQAQLTHAKWEKSLRGPVKWIAGKLLFGGDSG
jgi:hypothetical protein